MQNVFTQEGLNNLGWFEVAPFKIVFPVLLSTLIFVFTLFIFILPHVEGLVMDRKREMINALTESALSTIHHYAEMAEKGTLTTAEAKSKAAEHIRNIRYGPEGKDYFWINDMVPTIIMHPYRTDLEGQDVSDYQDPTGKRLFVLFVETVRQNKSGYVDYQWQWKDNPSLVVPKISYVQGFEPWGWIVGTGVYVEDVRTQISDITQQMFLMCLAIFILLILLSGYVIRQGIHVEHQRRQTALSLRRSEEKYRLLAETAREIILILDEDLCIIYANNAWMLLCALPREMIIGLSILDLLPQEHRPHFEEKLKKLSADKSNDYLLETEFLLSDGRKVDIEATFARMDDSTGSLHYLMAARDITEKKRAEARERRQQEQLIQTDKMVSLGTLVSGVAHEINNPLSSVMLNIEVFAEFWKQAKPILDKHYENDGEFEIGSLEYPQMRERFPKLLNFSHQGIARVKHIVGDLKDFAGQSPTDSRENIELNQVVQKSIDLVSSLIKKATNHFSVEFGSNLPALQGNSQRLQQVVINLLVNACQATPGKDKPLRVATGYLDDKGELYAEIRDSGDGMDPAIIQRIKDPFFTTKRNSGGTGLGLSISDTIVRDHGGRLEFSSQPGQGTTATVWLPGKKPETLAGEST